MNQAKPPTPSDVKVLVVDDEGRLRDVLTRAIASWGFQVAGARSGEEALRLMQSSKFDISILDLNLPGVSGIELFEKLRADQSRAAGHRPDRLWKPGGGTRARSGWMSSIFWKNRALSASLKNRCTAPPSAWCVRCPSTWLPPKSEPEADDEPVQTLEDVEREHIISALRRNDGNRTATALELGISRRTLQYKLSEYHRQGFAVDE